MRHPFAGLAFFCAVFFLMSTAGSAAPTPLPAPSSANSLFQDRPFGPLPTPTPTPERTPVALEDDKPIPQGWWIGGIAVAALAILALLFGAVRAWRSSNLFGQQYRFAADGNVALRLGGKRTGGHMATIRFGEGQPLSKTEDA